MGWTQPHYLKRPLQGQDGKLDHPNRGREEGPVMKVTTIGIDLAKDVFGLHGVDGQGRVAFKKRLVRRRLLEFMSQLTDVFGGPGSLLQRTLLGAQARAAIAASSSGSASAAIAISGPS